MHTVIPTHAPRGRMRRILATGALAATIAAVPLVAGAATPDTEATYTGCLRVAGPNIGTFAAVAPGSSPVRNCNGNEKPVHVSGGDITAVSAGEGISMVSGGGWGLTDTEGNATVALDPNYKLPQNCLSGEIPFARPQSTGHKWGCTAPPERPLPPAVASRQVAPGGQQNLATGFAQIGQPVTLATQEANWMLNVRIDFKKEDSNDIDDMIVVCQMRVTDMGSGFVDQSEFWHDGATGSDYGEATMNLVAAVKNAPAGSQVVLVCADVDHDMQWVSISMTATPVQAIAR